METSSFYMVKTEFRKTVFPNGLTLISGDMLTESKQGLRPYEILISGGRLADTEPPGTAMAFQRAFTHYCDETCAKLASQQYLSSSLEDVFLQFRYVHHGRDQRDAICLRWLADLLMHETAFHAAAPEKLRYPSAEEPDRFWTWFLSRLCPSWHRMHLHPWEECAQAQTCSPSDMLRFQRRYIHTRNMLVLNSQPQWHEMFAEALQAFPRGEGEVFSWPKALPTLVIPEETYPFGPAQARQQARMFCLPFPQGRGSFFLATILLEMLYGTQGLVHQIAKKMRATFSIRTQAVYRPLPIAFVFVQSPDRQMEKATNCIIEAPRNFEIKSLAHQFLHVQHSLPQALADYAQPKQLLIDAWMADEAITPDLFTQDKMMDLTIINRVYFNESRYGCIDRIPNAVSGF